MYSDRLTVDMMLEQLKAMDTSLSLLKDFSLNSLATRSNTSLTAMMEASTYYHGNQYILSHIITTNVHEADRLCRFYGGYVAEINDAQELTFISHFLSANIKDSTPVLLGATDDAVEGSWELLYSKTMVTYLNWQSGQPSGGRGENCLFVSSDSAWTMFDGFCIDNTNSWTRFLCEIP